MTFKEAFAKARKEKGAGKTFTWNGKQYTTDYASDGKAPVRPKARPTAAPTDSPKPRAKPGAPTKSSAPKARPSYRQNAQERPAPTSRQTRAGMSRLSEMSKNPRVQRDNPVSRLRRAGTRFKARMDAAEKRARDKLFPLYKSDEK